MNIHFVAGACVKRIPTNFSLLKRYNFGIPLDFPHLNVSPNYFDHRSQKSDFCPSRCLCLWGWPCGKWAGCNDARGAMGDVLDKQCTQCEWYPHSPVQCILLSLKPLFCLSSWLAGWLALFSSSSVCILRHRLTAHTHTHTLTGCSCG